MANIIPLFGRHNTAADVLNRALDNGYKEVLVVGVDDTGLLSYHSHFNDAHVEIGSIEIVKFHLIKTGLERHE